MRALYPGFDTLLERTQKRVALVVGSDLFHPTGGIATWGEGVAALLKNIFFLVSQRGDEEIPEAIELADGKHPVAYEWVYPDRSLSSTAVRAEVKAGKDQAELAVLTPVAVAAYILQNGLYVQKDII